MTTQRRQRVRKIRIRAHDIESEPQEEVTTQEAAPPEQQGTTVPKPPPPPEPLRTNGAQPQVNEQVLAAKDLVRADELLANVVMTPTEVSCLLRVSLGTVMKLVHDGDLPALRMERQTRFLRIDVLRFMRDLRDKDERVRRWQEENQRQPTNQ